MPKSPDAEDGKRIDQRQERDDNVQCTLDDREYEIHFIHRERSGEAIRHP